MVNYCQRCVNGSSKIGSFGNTWFVEDGRLPPKEVEVFAIVKVVPESECEFWAHEALNKLKDTGP